MPEVIDIRTAGGGHEPDEAKGQAPIAPRRIVLVAVAAVIVVFSVAYLVSGRGGGRTARSQEPSQAGVVAVASGALDGWGRFAVSGRLEEVAPYFDPDGPQFERFRQEAAELAAHPPGPPDYRFTMSDATAERKDGEWLVRGPVVVSRPGEADQRFAWELVIRKRGDSWFVWTVRESTGRADSTVGGTP